MAVVPSDIETICQTSRNVIAHYRAEHADTLPEERRDEIDSRWLEVILDIDQQRHHLPLTHHRPITGRVAGCCRDHSLFVVGALRQRQVPAHTRIGFAHYLIPGWATDHVIVEYWRNGRWLRADAELNGPGFDFDVHDVPAGHGAPFETAAEAWLGHRAGTRNATRYGVFPGSELSGPDFVRTYVFFELAHRYGDELLLWDSWGATEAEGPEIDALTDELARLLVAADGGDDGAESELATRYTHDNRLRPGSEVTTYSPYGNPPRTTSLHPTGPPATRQGGAPESHSAVNT